MGVKTDDAGGRLTERQKKWFTSVKASLERETGKTLDQWVAIARSCPETARRARTNWLREHHGLGINRASCVLLQAFPSELGWDEPDKLRAALWTDPASTTILEAVEAVVADFDGMVTGQRKGFTAWSNKVQFAAIKPVKGGTAILGLSVTPDLSPRLSQSKNESWSERLKAKIAMASPAEVDAEIRALLRAAWERS